MSIFSTKNLDEGKSPLFITRRPVTLIPPIRLNIEDVEKALQADCKRDKQLRQLQTLDSMNFSRAGPHPWLPLFDSTPQENDSGKEINHATSERSGDKNDKLDRQPTKISLKRLKPILFETSKRKLQKTAHDHLDIVLDKQNYLPLFQQSQKWCQRDNATADQEQGNSSVTGIGNVGRSSDENQSQQQQQQQQPSPLNEQQQQQYTIDILEEVLGETDYNARSRIILPTNKKRDASSSKKKDPPTSSTIAPPLPTSSSSTSTSIPAAASTSTSSPSVSLGEPSTSVLASKETAVAATTPPPPPPAVASTISPPTPLLPPSSSSNLAATAAIPTPTKTTDTSLPNPTDNELDTTVYAIPRQNIPVFGTPLQYTSIQQEISRLHSFSTSALKHHVGKVMDILNHPMIALLPEYTDPDDGHWDGSGKTLLLQQLLARLEERDQVFNLAIVCYDVNAEEFLMNLIKPRYPVQRLNTVKKDDWDQEYGVIVKIKKNQPVSLPKSTFRTKVDLAIIMDIRVQLNDSVMNMFENTTSSGPPPIVSLITNHSVELRLQDYLSKLSPPKWRLPDQVTCASVFDTKNDTPVENSGLLTYMVVDSVIRWIDSGMQKEYQFVNDQSIAPQQVDTDLPLSTPPSPSPRSTIEEHQQQNRTQTDQTPLPARNTSSAKLNKNGVPEETSDSTTTTPSLQEDLAKLFSHVSLERLQHDLKSYTSTQGKSSNQHYSARSDDEDSFYSAKSDSLSDDNTFSKIQAVMDSLQGTFADIGEATQSSDMLKSMKMEFDKKCLGIFQAMVSSYRNSVTELQKEYAAEVERKLALPSTSISTNPSS